MTPLVQKHPVRRRLAVTLDEVANLSRDELLGVAIARGCRHYASFVAPEYIVDRPGLAHEVLGCALLRGMANLDTFQSIRVGAMVLSDAGCSPTLAVAAAEALGVESRLAHIARTALVADDRPGYWGEILTGVPAAIEAKEVEFLPGASRFRLETGKRAPGLGAARIWLRTQYVT